MAAELIEVFKYVGIFEVKKMLESVEEIVVIEVEILKSSDVAERTILIKPEDTVGASEWAESTEAVESDETDVELVEKNSVTVSEELAEPTEELKEAKSVGTTKVVRRPEEFFLDDK